MAREDLSLSFEERARRAWVLIDSQVIGDDRKEPKLTPEAFEIIFEGMARAMDLDVARSLGGPIEWEFSDAEPWHLVVVNGHAEAKPGRAGKPAIRLESSSAEWAKFAIGKTDPRWAIVKRKLKLHGPISAKAKLPKLFA